MTETVEKARGLFVQGIQAFEAGRFEAAEAHFLASLEQSPGRVSTLTNLAGAQIRLARPQAALDTLAQALASDPDNPDAWWHRAIALTDLGRPLDALSALGHLLALQPAHVEAWVRQGQTLQQLDRNEAALLSYDKALALEPNLALAWSHRGGILKDLQRLDEAANAFRQAIAHGGDAELNGYFLVSVAPVAGQPSPASAPALYVESLFDNYAPTFDVHLVDVLHYQAHTTLLRYIERPRAGRFRTALDLGCGTGLCGPLLRPLAEQVDGVDLSRNMLAKARALGVYQRLVQADITAYLRTTDRLYDLVVAADVFIYVGDLGPIFSAVASAMDGAGVFCFSIEMPDNEASDFELKTSLRYGQSEAYLRGLAERHGFDVSRVLRHPIRDDRQRAIEGLYVYLQRR